MSVQEGICPKCIRELKEKAERDGRGSFGHLSFQRVKGFWGTIFGGPTKCLCTHCGQIYYEKD